MLCELLIGHLEIILEMIQSLRKNFEHVAFPCTGCSINYQIPGLFIISFVVCFFKFSLLQLSDYHFLRIIGN
jgi:hypothetical protein